MGNLGSFLGWCLGRAEPSSRAVSWSRHCPCAHPSQTAPAARDRHPRTAGETRAEPGTQESQSLNLGQDTPEEGHPWGPCWAEGQGRLWDGGQGRLWDEGQRRLWDGLLCSTEPSLHGSVVLYNSWSPANSSGLAQLNCFFSPTIRYCPLSYYLNICQTVDLFVKPLYRKRQKAAGMLLK